MTFCLFPRRIDTVHHTRRLWRLREAVPGMSARAQLVEWRNRTCGVGMGPRQRVSMTPPRPRPTGSIAFVVWLLALGSTTAASAQSSTPVPDVVQASTGLGVQIHVESPLGAEREARVAPREPIERCIAGGVRRLPALGGTARFQIHWDRDALVIILVESTLGEHRTERCLRRAIGAAGRSLRREIGTEDLVAVEVSTATPVRLCHLDGTEVSTGRDIPECAMGDAARAAAERLSAALGRARVRPTETLAESCGFTHVHVWLDARGRLLSYGVSSVNSDGEDPALNEYASERAAALRVLSERARPGRHDAGSLHRLVIMLGGCD